MTSIAESASPTVAELESSPVHNLFPLFPDPVEVALDDIEIDETNPGHLTDTLRYKRRDPSMADSWDILGGIVYPIVVCIHPDKPDKFMHVDGFGRYTAAKARGAVKIRAIIYPALTLEQRICLRETLNAAQEPFDVASVIKDLQQLAAERKLDLTQPSQIKMLLRDLPERVRKREADLLVLARWHPDVVKRIGESYGRRGPESSMGMDKAKELTKFMDVMGARHPKTTEALGGEMAVSKRLFDLYQQDAFSKHGRSQEGIRAAVDHLDDLPADDDRVGEFFAGEYDITGGAAKAPGGNLVKFCEELSKLLLTRDESTLTESERRALKRTMRSIEDILS